MVVDVDKVEEEESMSAINLSALSSESKCSDGTRVWTANRGGFDACVSVSPLARGGSSVLRSLLFLISFAVLLFSLLYF